MRNRPLCGREYTLQTIGQFIEEEFRKIVRVIVFTTTDGKSYLPLKVFSPKMTERDFVF